MTFISSTQTLKKCKHLRVVITRTYDLKQERATCEDCPALVPNWKTRPHVFGKHHYRYVFVQFLVEEPPLKTGA
jgi:hypothetical protein